MSYDLIPITNYPDDGNHLEVYFLDDDLYHALHDLEVYVRRGEDWYWYYDKKDAHKRTQIHLWYATMGSEVIERKGFRNVDDAIKAMLKHVKKHLETGIAAVNREREDEHTKA